MKLEPEETKAISARMKRAHGHLGSVIRMLDEGEDCEAVLTQLAAVTRALSRSGYALVATSLQQCMAGDGFDKAAAQRLEKVFLALA